MTPDQRSDILEILGGALDMTIATVREDGYPQATTVSFVHDGLTIYFVCGSDSQKARNIERSGKVSLTVNLPYEAWTEIRGLSLGGHAEFVQDEAEIARVNEAMLARFPQIGEIEIPESEMEQMRIVRITPEVISLLDYRVEFGHTEEIRV